MRTTFELSFSPQPKIVFVPFGGRGGGTLTCGFAIGLLMVFHQAWLLTALPSA